VNGSVSRDANGPSPWLAFRPLPLSDDGTQHVIFALLNYRRSKRFRRRQDVDSRVRLGCGDECREAITMLALGMTSGADE
jgi:hypothetical protein